MGAKAERCAGLLFRAPGPKYLLLHRSDRDEWETPGGHVEAGETNGQAARREALEEVAYDHQGDLQKLDTNEHAGVRYTLHLGDVPDQFTPQLNHEHDQFAWVGPLQLPHSTHPQLKRVLDKLPHTVSGYGRPAPGEFDPQAHPYWNPDTHYESRQGGKVMPPEDLEQLAREGQPGLGVDAAALSTEERNALPGSDFAVPGKRALPMHDKTHVKLAWDMVDRTQGLTSAEKAEARKRILRRARELGVDTEGWHVRAAMELKLEAMSLLLPDVKDHPNKAPFSGIMTRIGVPSDKSPGGSDGKRVTLTAEAVDRAIPSLLGMGVDYTPSFDGHDPQRKIGVITGAKAKGNALHVEGFFYASDFPEVVAQIQANKRHLGWSYEILAVRIEDLNANPLVVTEFVFTGAAVLRKDAAAYSTTTIAANAEDKAMPITIEQLAESVATLAESVKSLQAAGKETEEERKKREKEERDEKERKAKEAAAREGGDGEGEDAVKEKLDAERRKRRVEASGVKHHTRRMRHIALRVARHNPNLAQELHDMADKIDAVYPSGMDDPDNMNEYGHDKDYFYDDPLKKPEGMEPTYDDVPDIHAMAPRRRSLSAGEFISNPGLDDGMASAVADLDATLDSAGITGVDAFKAKMELYRSTR
ncbi:NUDIX domain-containing protein [Acidiferrobacter sp.]|uniref:NUDIX domain-containing protein n=1 Tax=Acidiferrobacter sp. TaxID=1872107 RepID=UPI002628226F|nr:NUDIX domain-containing protein [Acidiferrobacter sp.]